MVDAVDLSACHKGKFWDIKEEFFSGLLLSKLGQFHLVINNFSLILSSYYYDSNSF
ncbi:MAG: hypothetical protein WBA22_08950 [Candidatus Methanofastidiosia archaeon]